MSEPRSERFIITNHVIVYMRRYCHEYQNTTRQNYPLNNRQHSFVSIVDQAVDQAQAEVGVDVN